MQSESQMGKAGIVFHFALQARFAWERQRGNILGVLGRSPLPPVPWEQQPLVYLCGRLEPWSTQQHFCWSDILLVLGRISLLCSYWHLWSVKSVFKINGPHVMVDHLVCWCIFPVLSHYSGQLLLPTKYQLLLKEKTAINIKNLSFKEISKIKDWKTRK
jgi:hypothetical protein